MPISKSNQLLQTAGQALKNRNFAEAERLARTVLSKDRRNADAHQLLGLVSTRTRRFADAVQSFQRACELEPRRAYHRYLLAKAYTQAGQTTEAIIAYDHAINLEPSSTEFKSWKAVALERGHRIEEARAAVDLALEAGHKDDQIVEVAVRLDQHDGRDEEAIARIDRYLAQPSIAPITRHVMSFLRARSLDTLDRVDESMAAYKEANSILAVPFDKNELRSQVDRCIAAFSEERMAELPKAATRAEWPVIIAGFPRSGTTLVERIISAHPSAGGVGETDWFASVVSDLERSTGTAFPACCESLDTRAIELHAWHYQELVKSLSGLPSRVADKSLSNWRLLGLVTQCLPGARVIWCRRSPLDVCISCYTRELMPGPHPFVSDLGDLGFAFGQHERLMRHWASVLDVPFLEVAYEDMIADTDGQTRRLLDFLGLPFDDRCLRFHESNRASTTLSYDQVRRPVYTSSVKRWKRYEAHLEPARAGLREAGMTSEEH